LPSPSVSDHARQAGGPQDGIYLLANDEVAGWLSACAASLRHFNPSTRVVVIAYDDQLRAVTRICVRFGFELWQGEMFAPLDEFAGTLAVAGTLGGSLPAQRARKLAAFWGPLRSFLYLDVDTVVLTDLSPVLAAARRQPEAVLFAHCDAMGGNLDEVYRAGAWRDSFIAAHGSHAGNAGIWAATRGLFTEPQLRELADTARPIASEFTYPYQGFLNFCLDHTATPVHNLHDLTDVLMLWSGVSGCRESAGALSDPDGEAVGVVHWAGYELDTEMPYRSLWEHWSAASTPGVAERARRWISSPLWR
jgi:hypothetical protein